MASHHHQPSSDCLRVKPNPLLLENCLENCSDQPESDNHSCGGRVVAVSEVLKLWNGLAAVPRLKPAGSPPAQAIAASFAR